MLPVTPFLHLQFRSFEDRYVLAEKKKCFKAQNLADWNVDSETEVWSGTLKVNFGKDLKQSFG